MATLMTSSSLTMLLVLITPLLLLMSPPMTSRWTTLYIKNTVRLACLMSLLPLAIHLNTGLEAQTLNYQLLLAQNLTINFNFIMDTYSLIFIPIAFYVTWSILEFSNWYMATDPNLHRFMKYLLLFLTAMITLVTANNLFQLFIGWEGVGAMSFMLIGWWSARHEANTSALQAIIYNRMGDIGFMVSMAWLATNASTWNIQEIFMLTPTPPQLLLMGLVLAATGKSAQFGLHPWLPAAMEGPTPVSALLHSSTMVVAGIFMLIRLYPLLENNKPALSLCLWLGAITTLHAAFCALTQTDIKKIIAFSTSSQLGLMMVTIGLGQPQLTFFHISTHAFFKAMLFLCAGTIIHSINQQDIRKLGGLKKPLPLTTSCMTIGNLALIGTPFMSGFYSKDTIIETMNTSTLNATALMATMFATALTAAYTMRLTFLTLTTTPRSPTPHATWHITETNDATSPILRLAMGSILSGLVIMHTMIPLEPITTTMTPMTKLSAMLVTIIGLITAMELTKLTTKWIRPNTSPSYQLSTQITFFTLTMHRFSPKAALTMGQTLATQLNDQALLTHSGPKLLTTSTTTMAKGMTQMQPAIIKSYLTMFAFAILMVLLLPYTT
uniref:NADH-ubiquinone oxidoreductase chain 5 n=1 Tax=Rhineura floridana TaxID=261503 RepID=Q66SY4_RHIFL|nr:NADH dehydrogenase subunit 5 [Rhineura floridana]AAT08500.1 NADH dehydrogenase subunit 5 [Rhineura floridana]